MKIVEFRAENVKKIKTVEINPDGSLVVIGGKNAQGKTSILDAILVALAGKKKLPPKMLRNGEEKGFVELDLGDIIIKRTFTKKGGNLKVSNKDGAVFQSPQKMLDKLVGSISFDPLEFTRLDSKKQVNLLKEITGLDFEELDEEREKLYTKRTDINRDGKSLRAQCDSIEKDLPDEIPEKEVLVSELLEKLEKIQTKNNEYRSFGEKLSETEENILEHKEKIKNLQTELKNLKTKLKTTQETKKLISEKLENSSIIDEEPIKAQINSAEATNKEFALGRDHKNNLDALDECRANYKELTELIKDIDRKKEEALAESNLPVENLTFDEDGVSLSGIPFEQTSGAEQLKTSVAIGLAANPKLKILLIKDGSLLDEDNLKLLEKMATKAGAQIWLERVSTGDEVSIIMEDGCIK